MKKGFKKGNKFGRNFKDRVPFGKKNENKKPQEPKK